MSIRPRASCLALFLVLYCSSDSALRHPAQAPAVEPAADWREVMASELEPETFYCPIAYARAPFVNVYALYRRGAPEVARPRDDGHESAGTRHFLLAGQQTAELRPTAMSDAVT